MLGILYDTLFSGNKTCPANYWQCRAPNDYRCIHRYRLCNGRKDCTDSSDEDRANCPTCNPDSMLDYSDKITEILLKKHDSVR